MKIFSVKQIKKWDAYTIEHEPIPSIDLMERAATACFDWLIQNFDDDHQFKIFCGRGNNGGDGLAIARLLKSIKYKVSVYIPFAESPGSDDFETNLRRLKKASDSIYFLKEESSFPEINDGDVIIDALFGTGLHKPAAGLYAALIDYLNSGNAPTVAIDVPSGLFIDKSSRGEDNPIMIANFTLTFQNQKQAFLLPENERVIGQVILLDIGLSAQYEKTEESRIEYIDELLTGAIYRSRKAFSHKGDYGHASLVAGSYGMMGAAVLCSSACLRSGAGKLTSVICESGYEILQACVPEAMCKVSGEKFIKSFSGFEAFDVVGIGPGIGRYDSHKEMLRELLTGFKKPLVIDADALNVLSEEPGFFPLIPHKSIITPHLKEFERLFGKSETDFDRIELALKKAEELRIYIVLKGHHTFIATPEGKGYFNSTGNAGMATAGSGDVLTGVITGLMAQKYSSLNSCILGVYLHGLAGDIAAGKLSEEALIARDIIDHLGDAFMRFY